MSLGTTMYGNSGEQPRVPMIRIGDRHVPVSHVEDAVRLVETVDEAPVSPEQPGSVEKVLSVLKRIGPLRQRVRETIDAKDSEVAPTAPVPQTVSMMMKEIWGRMRSKMGWKS